MERGGSRLRTFAWATLGLTELVILWGAVVRATGSGAGCGSNWPSCTGEIIPLSGSSETLIEFTHRAMSGLALIAVALLWWGVRASYEKKHRVRRAAFASAMFILAEAVIGAGLVLFELTADDASVARAIVIGLHLVNTFLLLASLALTAWWLSGRPAVSLSVDADFTRLYGAGVVALLVVGAFGAVTALGDTLFPADSLVDGIRADLSPGASFLVSLRVIHPIVAIAASIGVAWLANRHIADGDGDTSWLARLVVIAVAAQVIAGFVNLGLLAPIGMQIVHLLLADVLWVAYVLFGAARLSVRAPVVEQSAAVA